VARVWIAITALVICVGPGTYGRTKASQPPSSARTQQAAQKTQAAYELQVSGKTVEAIEAYREALSIAPDYEPALLGLGDALRGIHDFDEARTRYLRAARAHPRSAGPPRALGNLELELQKYDAAIVALRKSLALDPNGLAVRADLAAAYAAKGDLGSAVDEATRVIARDPKQALALFVRASAYSDQNEDAKAYADAETLFTLAPNPKARTLLAKVATRVGKCARAVEVLQPLAGSGANSEVLFLLGRAYQCAGDAQAADSALARYKQASEKEQQLATDEIQSTHLVQQAEEEAQKNHLPQALELVSQAIEKNRHNGDAYALLAKLRFSVGQTAEARTAIQKALDIDATRSEYLYVLGKIQQGDGEFDSALATFRMVTAINPRESDAYYEMGMIYQKQGDPKRAEESLKQALAIAPDDADYRRALDAINSGTTPQ
jgi:tetratricopeptide (TPR) repeat protein